MSIKRFDDIEGIIKKSAETYQPAFDEEAWHKMEVLLNGEKDFKKPIFWLWWLLPSIVALSAGGYFIFKNEGVKNSIVNVAVQKNNQAKMPVVNNNVSSLPVAKNTSSGNNISSDNIDDTNKPTGINIFPLSVSTVGPGKQVPQVKKASPKKSALQNDKSFAQKKSDISDIIKSKANFKVQQNNAVSDENNVTHADKNKNQQTAVIKSTEPEKLKVENKTYNEKTIAISITPAAEQPKNTTAASQIKDKQSKLSRMYLLIAAGAETNGVKLFSSGKITAKTGFAVGYQLTKKLSIQTGFFSNSKKYMAGPADYKTKPGTYWGSVMMTKIDANCKVYEIPLAIRFDFANVKKIKIFSAAALSSYIMKKEDYHYYYNRYGYPSEGHGSYKGNQHLFSVIKISTGIEKNISQNFSLHVAPGLAIPLAGIGEGQVKLFSTDLLVGIKYHPQKKIKNK